ncbi:BglG family transcription antiterminator [Sporolactobacillus terrae]|uniref:BglG family transcription antiterminator n=1 Tax=Sporolactobacillus terrae TaxID=269673 RepID=UPI0011184AD3|nr:BglG family transcription antiterminator [Sporolactobacillus terrae]
MSKNVSANKKELVLHYLLDHEGYLSTQAITQKFKISPRTLYYIFDAINHDLMKQDLEPIQNVRRAGYYLKRNTKLKLRENPHADPEPIINFSKDERCIIDPFLCLISTKKVTVDQLAEVQNVSRNTVLSDIQWVRKKLEKYKLTLTSTTSKGYNVSGNEADIRWWFYELIENHLAFFKQLKKNTTALMVEEFVKLERNVTVTFEWIEDVERLTGKHFSDDTLHVLTFFIPFVMSRLANGNVMSSAECYEANVLRNDPEYPMIHQLFNRYGRNAAHYEGDVFYLEALLLSSQINYISSESNDAPQRFIGLENEVEEVIKRFQYISGMRFENTEELKKNLYLHLLACYYRVKYGVNYKNRWLKQIKKNYSDVFSFTKFSIVSFADFCERPISEDEIALISLYFGAEIDRLNRNKGDTAPAHKVLLVCSSGVGTASILKQKLQSMFPFVSFEGPITERAYMKRSEVKESIVISTISLPIKNKKVMLVHALPDQHDLKILSDALVPFDMGCNQLVASILDVVCDYAKVTDFAGLEEGLIQLFSNPDRDAKGGYQPMLSELLTRDTVQVAQNQGMNWKQAIQKSAEPLLKKGKVTSQYIDAMIEVVNQHGPFINIGKGVALAHARPDKGVNHLSMSLLKLDKPVDLVDQNHPVTLFFTLAAVDNTAHLKALSELASLLGEATTLEQLLKAQTKEDLLSIIEEEEKK